MTPVESTQQASPPPSFFGLSRDQLADHLVTHGQPTFRAQQLFSWVYQKHERSPGAMTNLPLSFRGRMQELCDLTLPGAAAVLATPDASTHKFVLELPRGAHVECVSMRTERRLTFCLSSQVGCALGCAFCATGLMGLVRNLSAGEIVAQVVAMGDFHRW
jgi:23S rRNA (adenine2503-C2)-methyltransferase